MPHAACLSCDGTQIPVVYPVGLGLFYFYYFQLLLAPVLLSFVQLNDFPLH